MKDKVLMISIHYSLRVRGYTSWINPKIYGINILSSSKCGTTVTRAAGMDRECHLGNHDIPLLILWHPYQPTLQMEITERLYQRISSAQLKMPFATSSLTPIPHLPSFLSPYHPLYHTPPLSRVSALRGEIAPIQSVSMRTISKQVQRIALFIMKVIYTCPLVELDLLPHCHYSAQGSFTSLTSWIFLLHTYIHTHTPQTLSSDAQKLQIRSLLLRKYDISSDVRSN